MAPSPKRVTVNPRPQVIEPPASAVTLVNSLLQQSRTKNSASFRASKFTRHFGVPSAERTLLNSRVTAKLDSLTVQQDLLVGCSDELEKTTTARQELGIPFFSSRLAFLSKRFSFNVFPTFLVLCWFGDLSAIAAPLVSVATLTTLVSVQLTPR